MYPRPVLLGPVLRGLVIGLLGISCASAQSTFGTIIGTVQDKSGSIVPDAVIRLTNLAENTVRATSSNAQGSYEFVNVSPGLYSLVAQKPGFASLRIPELRLDARQERRADLTLEVATVAETVEVAEKQTAVNTENGTISDTKDFRQVTQLPINYRGGTTSPLGAIVAVPGVQQDASGNISIGGSMSTAMTEFSIDGVNSNYVRSNGPASNMYPSSELLDEFRVSAVNNNAEFSSVGDVTVTTKSGTNRLRGSVFEYLQNADLDAKTYGALVKQAKVYNTFGFSLGGPIYIPKLYNGKNRTFFFIDYEGNRHPGSSLQQDSVPTANMRTGNLAGVPGGAAVDPTTGAPFPNNTIPLTRLNQVSQNLLSNYYPLPNSGLSSLNANYVVGIPLGNQTDGYDIRIDQYISAKHQLYGRWSWKEHPYQSYSTANTLVGPTSNTEHDKNLILSDNYAITTSLLNEFRFGFSLFSNTPLFPAVGADVVKQLGITGLNLTNHPDARAFPGFNFNDGTGFTSIGSSKVGPASSGTIQFTDNLSWVKGKHTLKVGFDLRRVGYKSVQNFGGSDDFGSFTFNSNTFTGNAYADFLLGMPYSDFVSVTGPDLNETSYHYSVYAQDEFRINSRLTLNFGLRWELLPPFSDASGNITNYDPATNTVITPDKTPAPAYGFLYTSNICPGYTSSLPCSPLITASKAGLPQGLRQTYKKDFDPRFSIAWRPFGGTKTVFRAGFGIFTITQLGSFAYALTGIHTTDTRTFQAYQGPGLSPLFTLPQAFAGNGLDPSQIGTQTFDIGTAINYRDPQSAQWNVTIERELAKDFSLRLSYIGMNSYRLGESIDYNQVPPSTTKYSSALKPFQNWDQLLSVANLGFANYQSFNTELNHRFSSGFFLQGSYTLAKNLTNVSDSQTGFTGDYTGGSLANYFNTRNTRGNAFGTRRNRVLVSGIYELPFGKGKPYMQNANAFVDAVFGGWQLSTVTMLQSGPFVTPTISCSTDQSNINAAHRGVTCHPDAISDGNLSSPVPTHWWNISAFSRVPAGAGRVGNAGVGILEGPGTIAVAGGLSKSFRLAERARLRFESTFTNLLNHPNFAVPGKSVSTPSSFGVTTTVQSAENSGNRVGQLSLRLEF